jgi:hypothetical protein
MTGQTIRAADESRIKRQAYAQGIGKRTAVEDFESETAALTAMNRRHSQAERGRDWQLRLAKGRVAVHHASRHGFGVNAFHAMCAAPAAGSGMHCHA